MSPRSAAALVLVFVVGLGGASAHADDLPDWVRELASQPTPASLADAPAYVLLDEERVRVSGRGVFEITRRRALRVLTEAGRSHALVVAPYLRGSSSVREMHAWHWPPGEKPRSLGRKEALDLSLAGQFTLDSESRALALNVPDAPVGSLFASEYVREQSSFVAQWSWEVRRDLPVRCARLSFESPAGVTPRVAASRTPAPDLTTGGSRWTWTFTDLPARGRGEGGCGRWSEDPGVDLDLDAAESPARGRRFESWSAVASWMHEVAAPRSSTSPEVVERVARLRPNAGADTLETLRALARDVQRIPYAAIELGLTRGGGFVPREPREVLRTGWGDCKDKANLLCAMYGAAGHEAWLVLAYQGGREHVSPKWPSPLQFNHCIVAVRVPRGTGLPAVFEHPRLGTLLAVDPTDPLSAFGDLPASEQGSWGLLALPEGGDLHRLPVAPPEGNRLVRHVEAALDPVGGLTGRLRERSVGQCALADRTLWSESSDEHRRRIEGWLSGCLRRVSVRDLRATDDAAEGRFELGLGFDAPAFGRVVQGRMITFSPAALTQPREGGALPDTGSAAASLDAAWAADTVVVTLPAGFRVDERPAALEMKAEGASLRATWTVEGDRLVFVRDWRVSAGCVEGERAKEIRRLFAVNLALPRQQVVLVRD